MRIQTELQKKIFDNFLAGKKYTETKFYRYSIRYNPASAVHAWIVRQKKIKDAPQWMQDSVKWELLQPLDYTSIQ